jgi:GABA(A) receptor-associated protein
MFYSNHPFKNEFSFEQRLLESSRVLNKYPDRIPIIVERSKKADKSCPLIDKKKYLVPRDLTVGQFIYVIRKRLKLPAEKAIFLFINNQIAASTKMIGEIYEKNRDADYFLYCSYSYENTFG